MKSYTDIKQSKKLAQILPLESADMRYVPFGDTHPWVWDEEVKLLEKGSIPCWSVGALIELMPSGVRISKNCDGNYDLGYRNFDTKEYLYMIDACYEMILKLHELKML